MFNQSKKEELKDKVIDGVEAAKDKNKDWALRHDYSGTQVWRTDNPMISMVLGSDDLAIPDGYTDTPAPSSVHDWDGKQWVLNQAKQTELDAQEKAIADAQLLEQKRAEKRAALDSIIVVTKSGKSFDGNETARVNMLSAITASEIIGQTKAGWKLADNTLAMVNVSEIKEALALSIIRVGQIVSEG